MLTQFRQQLLDAVTRAAETLFERPGEMPAVELETPGERVHGEFACNIAMKSARVLRKAPLAIAQGLVPVIEQQLRAAGLAEKIDRVEVKAPGFINFYLSRSALYDILLDVFARGDAYGQSDFGRGQRVQIEFVSANPTGPLSVAHARQAAVGDCLGNILNFVGFAAQKEYYVNDEGNQINILGRSIRIRAREILGDSSEPFPEEGYQGDYIRDMAQVFIDQRQVGSAGDLDRFDPSVYAQFGVDYLLAVIRKELDDFGVTFDTWSHQHEVASARQTAQILDALREKGFLYEKDGAVWFSSTRFGDDKDRVLKKSDGSYTYFAPDIAYHQDKFRRGFKRVVNIWGPDHHGYIPRLTAAVEALGQPRDALQVLIVQLATIYRDGKPVSMSTRRGQYISLREVMEEVGVDAARFFFLMRSISAPLEFDLDLAKKETPENPVYYIQYAHARVHSMAAKAAESGLAARKEPLALLGAGEELELIKRIGQFPEILRTCAVQMDAFALVNYLLELATCFHKFYDVHRVVDPQNPALSAERLALADAVRIVLANGLRLVGVRAPEKM